MGSRFDRHLLFGADGALCSEAGTGDDDHVRVVIEPIQTGRSQQGVSEQVGPFFRCTVAGDYVEYAEMSSPELAVSAFAKPPADLVRSC